MLEKGPRADRVSDSIGMTSEELDSIFRDLDDLSTVHKTGNAPATMGLGIATTARIVRKLGGQLQIESTPGSGTRVLITLPMYEPTQDPRRSSQRSTEPREVDDLVSAMLESHMHGPPASPTAPPTPPLAPARAAETDAIDQADPSTPRRPAARPLRFQFTKSVGMPMTSAISTTTQPEILSPPPAPATPRPRQMSSPVPTLRFPDSEFAALESQPLKILVVEVSDIPSSSMTKWV
jgi:hypothetical protein